MRRTALLCIVMGFLAGAGPASAQQFQHFDVPGASPVHIVTGPDGALWYTAGARIGRMTTDGRAQEFTTPGVEQNPRWISAGRDALYYTDSLPGEVGRVALDGTIEEVSVQTCPAALCGTRFPDDLTVAPDGSVWFSVDVLFASGAREEDTYQDVCSLGPRLEPGECTKVDEVGVPSGHASGGPTTGPDGAMWFTNKNENVVGRIPATGRRSVRKFPLPSQTDPEAIVTGPDGALWIAEPSRDALTRMTTSGSVTRFPLPRQDSAPFGITGGPDGAVWFTEYGENGNAIGRITPAGVITEFPLPREDSQPYGITTGPDGAMWFAEVRTARIGRIVPPRAPASSPPPPIAQAPPAAAAPPAVAPPPPPAVRGISVRPRRLRAGARRRSLVVAVTLGRPLRIAVRLQRSGRGRRVIRRAAAELPAGSRRLRLRLPARGLRRGRYQVVVEARERGAVVSRTTLPLVVRRKR